MENYKTKAFDSETLEFVREIETQIPEEIVLKVKDLLDKFNSENWLMTPLKIKLDGTCVYFGVLERGTDGEGQKYKITISKVE
jgi:hypothetical protein